MFWESEKNILLSIATSTFFSQHNHFPYHTLLIEIVVEIVVRLLLLAWGEPLYSVPLCNRVVANLITGRIRGATIWRIQHFPMRIKVVIDIVFF